MEANVVFMTYALKGLHTTYCCGQDGAIPELNITIFADDEETKTMVANEIIEFNIPGLRVEKHQTQNSHGIIKWVDAYIPFKKEK